MVKPFAWGIFGSSLLLGIYFLVVSLISGFGYAQDQFRQFWYFVMSLSLGFGLQVGMYVYLRERVKKMGGKTLAVSGTTSTIAMLSCCSHYLANVLPFLGIAGALSFLGQYQREFFWIGLLFNFIGIAYLVKKIFDLKKYEIH